jgi:hypothetical protein
MASGSAAAKQVVESPRMPVLTTSPEDEYSYRAVMPTLLADHSDRKLTRKERKDNRRLYRWCLRQYKIEIREQAEVHLCAITIEEPDSSSALKVMLKLQYCFLCLELAVIAHCLRVRNLPHVVKLYMSAVDELLEILENQASA